MSEPSRLSALQTHLSQAFDKLGEPTATRPDKQAAVRAAREFAGQLAEGESPLANAGGPSVEVQRVAKEIDDLTYRLEGITVDLENDVYVEAVSDLRAVVDKAFELLARGDSTRS
jgi:hypothetical protein